MSVTDPNPPSGQAELNDWIIAKLFVVERLTTSLLSLWVSAVPSDEEVAARIGAVRTSAQAGIDHLPDGVRGKASAFLAETLDRTEHNIKKNRAAVSATPRALQ